MGIVIFSGRFYGALTLCLLLGSALYPVLMKILSESLFFFLVIVSSICFIGPGEELL